MLDLRRTREGLEMSYESEERRPMRGFRPCRACKGEGKVLVDRYLGSGRLDGQTVAAEEEKCPACGGKGIITR